MRILLVNSADVGGGAEGSAYRLFNALQDRGHESWLAVGKKRGTHEKIFQIPNDEHRNSWAKFVYKKLSSSHENNLAPHVLSLLRIAAEPRRWLERQLGVEDFNYPGSRHLLELTPDCPDIVHLLNLHGDYFDLGLLPGLSRQVPVILNPRDAWLLSGHCAHASECDRWKTGCGHCPDLTRYPSIKRDATAYNWKRKGRIFAQSHLYITTPSHWLMNEIEQSILSKAIVKSCVIPTGIDLAVFFPSDKNVVRTRLGIPLDSRVLLFTANKNDPKNNWKDNQTVLSAIEQVLERLSGQKILFIALGGAYAQIGKSEIKFVPFQQDRNIVADYYRAADVYLHAARADTFPNAVMESLACGTPVIATNVGGIPEQVNGFGDSAPNNRDVGSATGILVNLENIEEMADAMLRLLTNEPLRSQLGKNAIQDSRQRFDFDDQMSRFLDWYQEVIEHWMITFGRR